MQNSKLGGLNLFFSLSGGGGGVCVCVCVCGGGGGFIQYLSSRDRLLILAGVIH